MDLKLKHSNLKCMNLKIERYFYCSLVSLACLLDLWRKLLLLVLNKIEKCHIHNIFIIIS